MSDTTPLPGDGPAQHTPSVEQRAGGTSAQPADGHGRTFVDGMPNPTSDDESAMAAGDGDLTDYGFEPAVSATGAGPRTAASGTPAAADPAASLVTVHRPAGRVRRATRPTRPGKPGSGARRNGLGRRIGAVAVLFGALAAMGSAYAAFATSSGAAGADTTAQAVAAGQSLYQVSCITCHGTNLQGVEAQGPSLIGVGSAAVYFQVSTGRMPVAAQGAEISRKEAKFNEQQTDALAAYVQSVGGGPELPTGDLESTAHDGIAQGGALFRLNCASCHGTTFKGAPLSGGKYAPSLNPSNNEQIYAAMLSGPESMPVFSDNQLTPTEKKQIIAYIQTIKASKDPGGSGIDRIGPVSEAIVIWVAGVGLLMVAILWIGARSR